jgi:hypothetical protein
MIPVDFTLVLDGKSFPIAKQNVIDFFELHPCLVDENAYQVRSPVSPGLITGQNVRHLMADCSIMTYSTAAENRHSIQKQRPSLSPPDYILSGNLIRNFEKI